MPLHFRHRNLKIIHLMQAGNCATSLDEHVEKKHSPKWLRLLSSPRIREKLPSSPVKNPKQAQSSLKREHLTSPSSRKSFYKEKLLNFFNMFSEICQCFISPLANSIRTQYRVAIACEINDNANNPFLLITPNNDTLEASSTKCLQTLLNEEHLKNDSILFPTLYKMMYPQMLDKFLCILLYPLNVKTKISRLSINFPIIHPL